MRSILSISATSFACFLIEWFLLSNLLHTDLCVSCDAPAVLERRIDFVRFAVFDEDAEDCDFELIDRLSEPEPTVLASFSASAAAILAQARRVAERRPMSKK